MKCNLIGAGRLGKNIALALSSAQIISSLSICNRSEESALSACTQIGAGSAVKHINELPVAELNWLCCNDDSLSSLVESLAEASILKPGSFVVHSSGVLTSALLAPLKNLGCLVASFHPLKAFPKNYLEASAFNQIDCVLEGDAEVCDWLIQAFTTLGAHVSTIGHEYKAGYHAAACIASNYMITLASCAEELFLQAGLPKPQVRRMLLNLMQGNLSNLQQVEHIADALTGPLSRGDSQTLSLHLEAISGQQQHLYQALGVATLPLTRLSTIQHDEIKKLFAGSSQGTNSFMERAIMEINCPQAT